MPTGTKTLGRLLFISRRAHLLTTCRRQAVVSPAANGALAEGKQTTQKLHCLLWSAHLLYRRLIEITTLFQFGTKLYRRPKIKSVSQLLSQMCVICLTSSAHFLFEKKKQKCHATGRILSGKIKCFRACFRKGNI